MRSRRPKNSRSLTPFAALLRLEIRLLGRNRVACLIIVAILAAAGTARFRDHSMVGRTDDCCYVVYWEANDWVRRLQRAAGQIDPQEGPAIRVVSVTEQTDADGVIRYPPGSHSIQLRPAEPAPDGRPRYLIWYWHDGPDPSVLWPYTRWFWNTTRAHFGEAAGWDERVSSLRPELVVPGVANTQISIDSLLGPTRSEVVLVWLILFFVAGHLATLSVAETRIGGMLPSLALSCAGWKGVALAKRLFYGGLAIGLAAAAAAMMRPAALLAPGFWLAVVSGAIVYLGLAFVVGCCAKTVGSASVGTMGYLLAGGLFFWLAQRFLLSTAHAPDAWIIPEAPLFLSLIGAMTGEAATLTVVSTAALLTWALVWHTAGNLAYRRLRA